jgi:hypothetical protein
MLGSAHRVPNAVAPQREIPPYELIGGQVLCTFLGLTRALERVPTTAGDGSERQLGLERPAGFVEGGINHQVR